MTIKFPAPLSSRQFLQDYWQKKPLLCKEALVSSINSLAHLLTAETLAGLSCEDEAESRLIRSHGPADQWRLQHGPFQSADFAELPEKDWSLLVQDVDKALPEVAGLLKHFSFLPAWRIDDIMISFAAPGGTVGPHIDQYDVFLVQGPGTRRWDIGDSDGSLVKNATLPVVRNFNVKESFELHPGDALYLPPGIAHCGHSDADCITLSVGFRAPATREIILAEAEQRANKAIGRYRDEALLPDEVADGLISPAAMERAVALLNREYRATEDTQWFGCLVSENKPWLQPDEPEVIEHRDVFQRRLLEGHKLMRHPTSRSARSEVPAFGQLFVDGQAWPLTASNCHLAAMICRADPLTAGNDSDCLSLLYNLYCAGKLYWQDE